MVAKSWEDKFEITNFQIANYKSQTIIINKEPMNTSEKNEFAGEDGRTNNNNPTSNTSMNQDKKHHPDGLLPEDDPAVINPDELATFPKPVDTDEDIDLEAERENHSVNRQDRPVQEGRNITRTDNQPDERGYI